jgi:hypothetical protein
MNGTAWTRLIIVVMAAMLIAVGCLARGGPMSDSIIEPYEQAMERFPGDVDGIERGLAAFDEAFGNLADPQVAERMRVLYAESIYFNDTLKTFDHRDDLVHYMKETGANLDSSSVEIKQVLRDGPDTFIRWTMEFRTRAAGRDIHSRSIGMTHLRFNAEGQVVLHQDFWDSGHGLYAHLPVVGFMVRRVHDRL